MGADTQLGVGRAAVRRERGSTAVVCSTGRGVARNGSPPANAPPAVAADEPFDR
ncbi:hypothetical protein SK128_026697, partial [Halocaridina rubra]